VAYDRTKYGSVSHAYTFVKLLSPPTSTPISLQKIM
jgi:hypothetical protein